MKFFTRLDEWKVWTIYLDTELGPLHICCAINELVAVETTLILNERD